MSDFPTSRRPHEPSNRMRALLASSFAVAISAIPASAQIAAWDFNGESVQATSTADLKDSNLTSSSGILSRGTGAGSSAGSNSFRTVGFMSNGIATTNTDYFETTLRAATGYTLSLSTIDARFAGTATFAASPGVTSQFAYSLNGTSFTLIEPSSLTTGATATLPQVTLSGIAALQNVPAATTITIRYYASGQTNTGGWGFQSPSAGQYGLAFGGTLTSTGVPDTTPPALASQIPAIGATGVSVSSDLSVTFNESVKAGTGNIVIKQTPGDAVIDTIPIANATITGDKVTFTTDNLASATSYYVQIAPGAILDIANNSFPGITNTSWTFTTGAPSGPPVVTATTPYTQNFSSFTSAETLPEGWAIAITGTGTNYSAWGTTDTGIKYSAGGTNVFGFQPSGNTGIATQSVTLTNGSPSAITDLTIAYVGHVARTEPRSPAFTINIDGGDSIPALAYSTADGDNQSRSTSVSGLDIPAGATFTINWISERGAGSGASKTIGLTNVSVSIGATQSAPTVAVNVPLVDITENSAVLNGSVVGDGGSAITARGFVYALTSTNPAPLINGTGVTNIVDPSGGNDPFTGTASALTPLSGYTVRSYATNSLGTSYSSAVTFTTLPTPPTFTGSYEQPFDDYNGTNPSGWTTISSGGAQAYNGIWGNITNSAAGFLGETNSPGVLGYQHTSTSGTLTIALRLVNGTGATLTSLPVSYLGRAERISETRSPAFVVAINGVEVPELAYSTAGALDTAVTSTVTGLSIPAGQVFTITWTSDRGLEGMGSSKQIGLGEVVIGGGAPPTNTYASWASANAGGQGPLLDFDNDGVKNGVEYFYGATGSTFTATPGLVANKISFPHSATAPNATGIIQTSPDLVTWTTVTAVPEPGFLTYTLPAGSGKLFVRLNVTVAP